VPRLRKKKRMRRKSRSADVLRLRKKKRRRRKSRSADVLRPRKKKRRRRKNPVVARPPPAVTGEETPNGVVVARKAHAARHRHGSVSRRSRVGLRGPDAEAAVASPDRSCFDDGQIDRCQLQGGVT
jgi:hypothetical protein